jgi:hypothetical protein
MSWRAEFDRYVAWTRRTRQGSAERWLCYPDRQDIYGAVSGTLRIAVIDPAVTRLLPNVLALDASLGEVLELLAAKPTCGIDGRSAGS